MKTDIKKYVIAGLTGAALVGAGIAGGFALDKPGVEVQKVEVPVPYEVEKIVEVEVPVAGEPQVITETVEVPVEDTDFAQKLCDRLVYDDLKECREEVEAEDVALQKAIAALNDESDLFDYLEEQDIIRDEDKASLLKVYDDYEDIEVVESDFDDNDYTFKIKVRVEDDRDDEKLKAIVEVRVDEGEVSFEDVELA